MTIKEKRDQYIVLFRGDDSDFVGNQQILLKLETELDLTGCKAHFRFLDFKQDFNEIPADKTLELVFPKAQTAKFPIGAMDAELWLEDSTGKRRTVANRIHVVVTNSVKQAYDNDDPQAITVVITSGSAESISWNNITGKPSTFPPSAHTHPISQVDGLQAELNQNVNKVQNATTGNLASLTSDGGIQDSGESVASLKEYTNTQVATNTANFLGTYDYATDLGFTPPSTSADVDNDAIAAALPSHVEGTPTNNDYVFVVINYTTTIPADEFRRFKYNATDSEWLYEYTLNSASFTPAQWSAINSGITGVVAPSSSATTGQAASAKATGDALAAKLSRAEAEAGFTEWTTDAPVPSGWYISHPGFWILFVGDNEYSQANTESEDATSLTFSDYTIDEAGLLITPTFSRTRLPTMADLDGKANKSEMVIGAVQDDATKKNVQLKTGTAQNVVVEHQQLGEVWTPTISLTDAQKEAFSQTPGASDNDYALTIVQSSGDEYALYVGSYSAATLRKDISNSANLVFAGGDARLGLTYGAIVATRSAYILGSQADKPLQPKGDYAPATDIPKTALASAVQTSLGKADTAVQPAALTSKADSAALAPAYSASSAYSVGDAVTHEGRRYVCNTAIAAGGEAWTAAHWTEESVQAALGSVTPGPDNTKLNSTSAAPAFSSSATYAVGDHCTYNGVLYVCAVAKTTASATTPDNDIYNATSAPTNHWTVTDMTTPDATLDVTSDGRLRVVAANNAELWSQGYDLASASSATLSCDRGNLVEFAATTATAFSDSTAYAIGDLVVHDGKVYKFTAAHAAGAWVGTDAEIAAQALTLPTAPSGKVGDFGLDVDNTANATVSMSASLTGLDSAFSVVVPKGENLADMLTFAGGELAVLYFTLTAFRVNNLPTWQVLKQVVENGGAVSS